MTFQIGFLVLLVTVACHGNPNLRDDRSNYNSIATGLGQSATYEFGPETLDNQLNAFDSSKQSGFEPKPTSLSVHSPSKFGLDNQNAMWTLGFEPHQPDLTSHYPSKLDIENEHRLLSQHLNVDPHQPNVFAAEAPVYPGLKSYGSGLEFHHPHDGNRNQTGNISQKSNQLIRFISRNHEQPVLGPHLSELDPHHQNDSRAEAQNSHFKTYSSGKSPDQQSGHANQHQSLDPHTSSRFDPGMLNVVSSHHLGGLVQRSLGGLRALPKKVRFFPHHQGHISEIPDIFKTDQLGGFDIGSRKGRQSQGFVGLHKGKNLHQLGLGNSNRFEPQRQSIVALNLFSTPGKSEALQMENSYVGLDSQHFDDFGPGHRLINSHHPVRYKAHHLSFSPLFNHLFKLGFDTHVGRFGSVLPGRVRFDTSGLFSR